MPQGSVHPGRALHHGVKYVGGGGGQGGNTGRLSSPPPLPCGQQTPHQLLPLDSGPSPEPTFRVSTTALLLMLLRLNRNKLPPVRIILSPLHEHVHVKSSSRGHPSALCRSFHCHQYIIPSLSPGTTIPPPGVSFNWCALPLLLVFRHMHGVLPLVCVAHH